MTTRFWCARCGRSDPVPRALTGRRVRCRSCGHVQPILEPADMPNPALTAPTSSTYALAPVPAPDPPLPPVPPSSSNPRRPRREESSSWRAHLRDLAIDAGRLQGLSLLLVTLSLTDLFVTFNLLRTSPRFYESNPVALWVFRRWDMAGMTLFKFAAISVTIALGELVERRRPGWGKAVLLVGCAATAVVVWHGLRLYLGFEPMPIVEGD